MRVHIFWPDICACHDGRCTKSSCRCIDKRSLFFIQHMHSEMVLTRENMTLVKVSSVVVILAVIIN